MRSISMRELRKIPAGAIQVLPQAVPIKSGNVTVGALTPVPSKPNEALAGRQGGGGRQ